MFYAAPGPEPQKYGSELYNSSVTIPDDSLSARYLGGTGAPVFYIFSCVFFVGAAALLLLLSRKRA